MVSGRLGKEAAVQTHTSFPLAKLSNSRLKEQPIVKPSTAGLLLVAFWERPLGRPTARTNTYVNQRRNIRVRSAVLFR